MMSGNILIKYKSGQYPRFSREQEIVLARQSKRPGKRGTRAKQQLLLSITPWAISIAKRHFGRGLDDDDVISVALLGAAKAVERFDPDRGNRLITFAFTTINQACMTEIWRYSRVITLPGRSNLKRTPPHLRAKIDTIIKSKISFAEALAKLHDCPAGVYLPDQQIEAMEQAEQDSRDIALCRQWMNTALDARQRDILDRKMRGETLQSIGRRHGVTRERVRQIVVKSIDILRTLRIESGN